MRSAWTRITANPDSAYKVHFRKTYTAYAIADEKQLAHLRDRLSRSIFEASDACKIYFPKPSGILRPYSLLCVEDQIVYQALANVVAEKLFPHVRHRYNKQVFGHLYAGSGSPWFYRRWSEGYSAFNKAAEAAFKAGYTWTASFDLTAFYDSIDHHVLAHLLGEIRVDHGLSEFLSECLGKWTATSTQIYHKHGIPQGPLSSGLIAEAVLRHFDERHGGGAGVYYFRYVDDIRLFAKSELPLRRALVGLDRLSKDVGLFPQSGKIDIHKVKRIEDELKSVSNPIEPALTGPIPDQPALRRRIAELSPGAKGYKVENPTKFKYLLARAAPSSPLVDRLWRIYGKAPHFYPQVARYLAKFKTLPARHSTTLVRTIEAQELYPAIRAELIDAAIGRLHPSVLPRARPRIKRLWKSRAPQPDLAASLWRWLQREKGFTAGQQRYALSHIKPPWLLASIHYDTPWLAMGAAQRERLLNASIRSQSADVAIAAAWAMAFANVPVRRPLNDANKQAVILLKELGLVRRAPTFVCGIRMAIAEMTGRDIAVDWRRFFGARYKSAEAQIVMSKGYFKTDPSAFVNAADTFVDWTLDALYQRNPVLGTYTLGRIGSNWDSRRLIAAFPAVRRLAKAVHSKRLESALSHAITSSTRRPTKRIPFKWLTTGARCLRDAALELAAAGY